MTARAVLLPLVVLVIAGALVLLVRSDDGHEAAAGPARRPSPETSAGGSVLSAPLPEDMPGDETANVRADTAPPAPRDLTANDPGWPGIPVRVTGPDGAPWSELLHSLRFFHPPDFGCRATRERGALGQGPGADVWRWAPLDRSVSPDAEASLIGYLVPTIELAAFAHLTVRGRVVRTIELTDEPTSLAFELSADDLLPYFSGMRVRFRGERAGEQLEGRVDFAVCPPNHNQRDNAEYVTVGLDEAGAAEVFGLIDGWLPVRAHVNGYARWEADPVLEHLETRDLGTIQLGASRSIAGRVTGEDHAERTLELIELTRTGTGLELGRKHVRECDLEGRFRFDDIAGREWILRVVNRRHRSKWGRQGPIGEEVEGILTRTGQWRGFNTGDGPTPRGFISSWDAYEQTSRSISRNHVVDTRTSSIDGLELPLLPLVDLHVHTALALDERRVITLRDETGVPFGTFELGQTDKLKLRLWPDDFELTTSWEDRVIETRSVRVEPGLTEIRVTR